MGRWARRGGMGQERKCDMPTFKDDVAPQQPSKKKYAFDCYLKVSYNRLIYILMF
jgi:hypothetical protein